jgi:hypothetical protein
MSQFVIGQQGEITLNTGTNISAAATREIEVKKPDGTIVKQVATLEPDNMSVKAVFAFDDFGPWKARAIITFTGSPAVKGLPDEILVFDDWKNTL